MIKYLYRSPNMILVVGFALALVALAIAILTYPEHRAEYCASLNSRLTDSKANIAACRIDDQCLISISDYERVSSLERSAAKDCGEQP